jgi:hypothetical protein
MRIGVRSIIVQLQGGRDWTAAWPFEVAARDALCLISRWSEQK